MNNDKEFTTIRFTDKGDTLTKEWVYEETTNAKRVVRFANSLGLNIADIRGGAIGSMRGKDVLAETEEEIAKYANNYPDHKETYGPVTLDARQGAVIILQDLALDPNNFAPDNIQRTKLLMENLLSNIIQATPTKLRQSTIDKG